jgi:hypothetical protein
MELSTNSPDEATQDQMMGVIQQNYPQLYQQSAQAPNAGAMPARPVTPTPQPSFTHRLLSNLAGVGQATDDEMRVMSDAATFGGADRFAAYMGGTNLDDERAQTEAAKQRLFLGGLFLPQPVMPSVRVRC